MKTAQGLMVGLVTSVKDDQGHGKVEVTFPRLPGKNRLWASVASPMAGKSRGFYLQPEVNDEVLVGFEDGDLEHPFILGFLWNGEDSPPESDPQMRVLVTPGGHQLRFEDNPAAKAIRIRTAGGIEISMNDAGKELSLACAGFRISLSPAGVAISSGT
jgi:uncharacterized protein involved in type VI secretion and phage assembly